MRHKSGPRGTASQKLVKDIHRATRKHYSAEEKIRIVLDGLRGEETIDRIVTPSTRFACATIGCRRSN